MKPRLVYIHGNQTSHWSFAWAGWLKAQLDSMGYETFFETMPDSIVARSKYWLPFLKDHVHVGPNDVLIGWSTGAVAALRYAEVLPVKGSILIAPSCTDLGDEAEKLSGYFEDAWQWPQIKANQQAIAVISSQNDPYIPQAEFNVIAMQLNAKHISLAEGGHFIDQTTFPELLSYIKKTYSDGPLSNA